MNEKSQTPKTINIDFIGGLIQDGEKSIAKIRSIEQSRKIEIGCLVGKIANDTIQDALLKPNPQPLWKTLWHEGDLSCLFASSGLGKSIYSVQIANEIAKSFKVALFDFELSDKQFQLRYTEDNRAFKFPDNLVRYGINSDSYNPDTFEKQIIEAIEKVHIETGATVLIVDNITYLCNNSEKGDMAGRLMFALNELKKKYGLSMLVIAHTPKRQPTSPLTKNDLAGSAKLYNFFDSAFAIGESAQDPKLRYVKQIKYRHGDFDYDADNVIVCQISKGYDSFTHFDELGFAEEREHLKEPSDKDRENRHEKIFELKKQKLSNVEIAKQLGISEGAVRKQLKKP